MNRYIILERPSTLMSSMIVLLRPFTSLKAARKLRQVRASASHAAASDGDQMAIRTRRHRPCLQPALANSCL